MSGQRPAPGAMSVLKRCVKVCISALFAAGRILGRYALTLIGQTAKGTCTVLCYHAVPRHLLKSFAWQLDQLQKQFKVIRADYTGKLQPGSRYIALTVDDAFTCAATDVLPEMEKRGMPFHLFVPVLWLGRRSGWWRDGNAVGTENVMTVQQLAAMSRNRIVSIGSHCLSHRSLVNLSDEEAGEEIVNSKELLDSLILGDVDTLSFPYGEYNERHVTLAREAGYRRVFTMDPRTGFASSAGFVTGRVDVDPGDWQVEFLLKAYGCYSWMVYASAVKRAAGRCVRLLARPFTHVRSGGRQTRERRDDSISRDAAERRETRSYPTRGGMPWAR